MGSSTMGWLGKAVFASGLLLSACGSDSNSAATTAAGTNGATPSSSSSVPDSSAATTTMADGMSMRTQYPLTIVGCGGQSVTFDKAPETIVSLDPQAYELLFWVGVGERQLAAGPMPLPAVPEPFKDASQTVTTIAASTGEISQEALLAAKPDFVIGSYDYVFSGDGVYTEQELADKGIATYWSLGKGGCMSDDAGALSNRPRGHVPRSRELGQDLRQAGGGDGTRRKPARRPRDRSRFCRFHDQTAGGDGEHRRADGREPPATTGQLRPSTPSSLWLAV